MTKPLTIDFVSDVACPWCVIGFGSLEKALKALKGEVDAELRFQPFELNPDMPPGGRNIVEHFTEIYGRGPTPEMRANVRARAAEVGFEMRSDDNSRVYNTFDAHRLLHWAGLAGRQAELKHRLFELYHTQNRDVGDRDTLVEAAASAGLDPAAARQVLESDAYAGEVRLAESRWRQVGINSVPSIVINGKYLITGGQPAEAFEEALRSIAAEG